MWRRTPDADDRPPDATGGCRRDAAWMLKNAEAMTLPRGGGATCKLDASDPKQRTYFDGYAAIRQGGMRRGGGMWHGDGGDMRRDNGGGMRRGDVKTDEKSSATNRAILSLVVLMKPLGLFSRALTLTQEKSCIFSLGAVRKRRRLAS